MPGCAHPFSYPSVRLRQRECLSLTGPKAPCFSRLPIACEHEYALLMAHAGHHYVATIGVVVALRAVWSLTIRFARRSALTKR